MSSRAKICGALKKVAARSVGPGVHMGAALVKPLFAPSLPFFLLFSPLRFLARTAVAHLRWLLQQSGGGDCQGSEAHRGRGLETFAVASDQQMDQGGPDSGTHCFAAAVPQRMGR